MRKGLLLALLVVGQGEALRALWFSDVHLDLFFEPQLSPACRCHASPGFNRSECSTTSLNPFGATGCDSPTTLLDSTLEYARSVLTQPNILLVTGDFVRHGNSLLSNPEAAASNATSFALTRIREFFPNTLVAWCLGNNDLVDNYYLDESDPVPQLTRIATAAGLSHTSQQFQDFTRGGYMRFDLESERLSIISLNTVLYAPGHRGVGAADPLGQFAWLQSALGLLRTQNRKAIIIGHIGPGLDTFYNRPMWHEYFVDAYARIVRDFKDVVIAQLFGHLHQELFRLMGNPPGMPPILLVSSIAPVYQNFPSFRALDIDLRKAVIKTSTTYFADMTVQPTQSLVWRKLYVSSKAYRLPNITSASLGLLGERLISSAVSEQPDLFNTFLVHSLSRPALQNRMSPVERLRFVCASLHLFQSEVEYCVEKFTSSPPSVGGGRGGGNEWKSLVGVLVPLVLAMALGIWCMVVRKRRQLQSLLRGSEPQRSNPSTVPE